MEWVKDAKELVKQSWWEWKEGMLYVSNSGKHKQRLCEYWANKPATGGYPDLTDWATIGILEGMVDISLVRASSCGYTLKDDPTGKKYSGGWLVQGGDIQVFAPTRGQAYARLLLSQKYIELNNL